MLKGCFCNTKAPVLACVAHRNESSLMLPNPRLASLSALPRGNGDAMSNVSSKADDAAPANAVLSGCVDACVGNSQGHWGGLHEESSSSLGSQVTGRQRHLQAKRAKILLLRMNPQH